METTQELEYRLLRNFIRHMPKTYRKRNCNWIIVQEFLQYGTTKAGKNSSIEKCVEIGIDPYGYTLDKKGEKIIIEKLTGYERVRDGQTFYIIDELGEVKWGQEDNCNGLDDRAYRAGNYHSNSKTAVHESNMLRLYRKMKRFSVERGWRDSFLCDSKRNKYYIHYDFLKDILSIGADIYPRLNTVYFVSEEVAEEAIKRFKEEIIEIYSRIKKGEEE